MDFYDRLNYSFGNEDWNVEEQALRVSPGDRILCVTASGDRALHFLMTQCADIISIDMNPTQNYLLDLKMAAICQLDYESYLAFLGCKQTPHRKQLFKQLLPFLSPAAAAYWKQHQKMITNGILYQGKTERLTKLSGKFMTLVCHEKVRALLEFTDIDAQRNYIATAWDTAVWREFFSIVLNPKLAKYIINDPGIHTFTEFSNQPGKYIYQRMLRYLNRHLASKSALLQLVLTGRVAPEAYFPYLTFDGYRKIRRDPSRLSYRTDNIVEYLHQPSTPKIHCFSMSDIASYMPQVIFERLLYGILQAAEPNARFCIREFMSKRYIPSALKNAFLRNQPLEQKLEIEESNFVYRFMAGEIKK